MVEVVTGTSPTSVLGALAVIREPEKRQRNQEEKWKASNKQDERARQEKKERDRKRKSKRECERARERARVRARECASRDAIEREGDVRKRESDTQRLMWV